MPEKMTLADKILRFLNDDPWSTSRSAWEAATAIYPDFYSATRKRGGRIAAITRAVYSDPRLDGFRDKNGYLSIYVKLEEKIKGRDNA